MRRPACSAGMGFIAGLFTGKEWGVGAVGTAEEAGVAGGLEEAAEAAGVARPARDGRGGRGPSHALHFFACGTLRRVHLDQKAAT